MSGIVNSVASGERGNGCEEGISLSHIPCSVLLCYTDTPSDESRRIKGPLNGKERESGRVVPSSPLCF